MLDHLMSMKSTLGVLVVAATLCSGNASAEIAEFTDSGMRLGPEAGITQDVAIGDLDNDGDPDVFTTGTKEFGIRIWVNDGLGNFSIGAEPVSYTHLTLPTIYSV